MKFEGKARPGGRLSIRILRADGSIEDRGVVCVKYVTNVFVQHLVDVLQAADTTLSDYKYHDSGTGTTTSAVTDTALELPCGDARTTGSQVEGAAANIYRTIATHQYAGNCTITEHGIFNASTSGKLLDRSTFTGVAITINDRIEFTYELTIPSGG